MAKLKKTKKKKSSKGEKAKLSTQITSGEASNGMPTEDFQKLNKNRKGALNS